MEPRNQNRRGGEQPDSVEEYRFTVDKQPPPQRRLALPPAFFVRTGLLLLLIIFGMVYIVTGILARLRAGAPPTDKPDYTGFPVASIEVRAGEPTGKPALEVAATKATDISASVLPTLAGICAYPKDKPGVPVRGTGLILSENGFLLTSASLLQSGGPVEVTLYDGARYPATLVGSYPAADVAVLYIATGNLRPVSFGASQNLLMGQPVIAIGAPGGEAPFVSAGVLSSLGRLPRVGTTADIYSFLQTDARVLPGCYGGALVDQSGLVIGMLTQPQGALTPGNVGYSSALPSKELLAVAAQLSDYGVVRPPADLGARFMPVGGAVASTYKMPAKGLYILDVQPGSALAAKGVMAGDVLMEAEGKAVDTLAELQEIIKNIRGKNTLALLVYQSAAQKTVHFELPLAADSPTGAGLQTPPV